MKRVLGGLAVDKESSWRTALLSLNSTIHDSISVLNDSSLKIVLVVDKDEILVGTVTDGDIRRGLLKGFDLSSSVSEILNKEPIVTNKKLSDEAALEVMSKHKIHHLPILDQNGKLVGMHLWHEKRVPTLKANPVVIMAGGKGTRLLPKTLYTPKPMLQIAGKPILEHIILRAKSQGFTNFILAIHHLGDVIENYFGGGDKWDVHIKYLREETPLGTAGALSLLRSTKTREILVVNGDVMTDLRLDQILEFHLHYEADATMAVQIQEFKNPYGVVETSGLEITGYEEKPVSRFLINAGIYVLSAHTLDFLEESTFVTMPIFFDIVRSRGLKTLAFPIHEEWADIGRHEDFSRVENQSRYL